MKWMRLSYKNFNNNMGLYRIHFFTLSAIVAIYYNFIALKHNPEILAAQDIRVEFAASGDVTATVIFIFVIFFIWYSGSYFLNQRKKEIGLFTLMGISQSDVAKIYVCESLFLSSFAIIMGELIGIVLGKLFMMILARVSLLDVTIDFFISYKGVLETAITFLVLSILMACKDFIIIRRTSLINLIKGKEKEELVPSKKVITGILGICLISFGYYLSSVALKSNFHTYALTTILVVSLGTFLFFKASITFMLQLLCQIPKFYYRRSNGFIIAQMKYRIRQNYRIYAVITILVAATITCFTTVASQKYAVMQEEKYQYPFTLTYTTNDESIVQYIDEELDELGVLPAVKKEIPYILLDVEMEFSNDVNMSVVKLSDYLMIQDEVIGKRSIDDFFLSKMNEDEAFVIMHPEVILSLNGKNYTEAAINDVHIIKQMKSTLFGQFMPYSSIVISDERYEDLAKEHDQKMFYGYLTDDETKINYEGLKQLFFNLPVPAEKICFASKLFVVNESIKYDLMGVIFFVGAFLALVFLLATGSILYFKVLTDAFSDQIALKTLMQLGMSDKDLKKIIYVQVGLYFFCPFFLGLLHTYFAIRVLQELMGISLLVPLLIGIILFLIVYVIYYLLAVSQYQKLINLQSSQPQ
ncbi:FtsX-like permease family protein [Vallitalea okinawensis]|uniref:FtsX-like permease family protein n=1 Tax=Vallitalea okinawensis TaxID=2078660 RepID=UPI000CFC70CC|nr:ABC transporter permease [Vallitalea okinawensis]